MSKQEAVNKILEYVYQQSEGHCVLCSAPDYPVKGNKQGYENVKPDEAEEWRIDHEDHCPISILEAEPEASDTQDEFVKDVCKGIEDAVKILESAEEIVLDTMKSEPEATEFTRDARIRIAARKKLLTISETSGLVAGSAFLTTLKIYVDLTEEACDIIETQAAENKMRINDTVALQKKLKDSSEGWSVAYEKLQAELKELLLAVPECCWRKCWACKKEQIHREDRTPGVLCRFCGSQDTRLLKEKTKALKGNT